MAARAELDQQGPLRMGTLGAAQITEQGLILPARAIEGVEVVAIAARERDRAERYALRHGIPEVFASYEALLASPNVDAIYNPLPNALHHRWTLAALRAGKHVLCEKPMAANAREAEEMARVADEEGRILAEAVHYRYHPMATRIKELVESGALGKLEHIEARMRVPVPADNIRRSYALAGGSIMDPGCYPLQMLRFFGGETPEILEASARTSAPDLDVEASARFRFASGATGAMEASMDHDGLEIELRIRGQGGELFANNPVLPHLFNELRVRIGDEETREVVEGEPTFTAQLRAFAGWIRGGTPMPTDAWEAVRNMQLIDSVYTAAGLPLRGLGK
ncbi:MAG: Gfo/Idh/MocA family oxidoreductase [Deltaproteobacteria bacterium]|nr:Gfo/Idh/MocA family oxidoreductase [Deltaproteobacteria bacterium]